LRAIADRRDSRSDPATVSVPTLVVVGAGDTMTQVPCAETIANGIPVAKLEIIPGAGHMLPVEKPTKLVEVLESYLMSLSP
jgi:pimeloyl-ACP methyl ester carboxylesterase